MRFTYTGLKQYWHRSNIPADWTKPTIAQGMIVTTFTQSQLEALAAALGDTADGLTGPEIGHLLQTCRMEDPDPAITKRIRLYNAFAASHNQRGDRRAILAFVRKALKPERFTRQPVRFEPLRAKVNTALAFAGLAVHPDGSVVS